jgi:gamma-glutamyl-gamma-aminobutyrate hydrolase PuuD
VGISGQAFPAGRLFPLEDATAIQSDYLSAVEAAGGLGVILGPRDWDTESASAAVQRLDAVVLTGGPDVEPHRYHQVAHAETYGTSTRQDDFESALFLAARAQRIPVLAICRGLQLVNVVLGGTLDQHITGRPGLVAHGVPNGGGGADTTPQVVAGTRLYDTVGASPVARCHHHQAIDQLGDGLSVSARGTDGVVEGIEYTDPDAAHWFLGVQWHPEETWQQDHRLFDALVAAGSNRH